MLLWYYKLLALHPKCVAFAVVILSIACFFVSITLKKIPDFTDPTLGFEARGTEIANRLTAWENLLEETRPSGRLTANPFEVVFKDMPPKHKKMHRKPGLRKKVPSPSKTLENGNSSNMIEPAPVKQTFNETNRGGDKSKRDTTTNTNSIDKKLNMKGKRRKIMNTTALVENYFCDVPSREYAHFVIERIDGANTSLFEYDAISSMCDLEFKLTTLKEYEQSCQVKMVSKTCCRPWSIPNYFALLSNRSSCIDLQEEDVPGVKQLLSECYDFYQNKSLKSNCEYMKCDVPAKCMQFDAVYHILHFLVDDQVSATNMFTSKAMLFLPIAKSSKLLPYYYEISQTYEPVGNISIVAIDMGLKNALFDELLIRDGWLIGLGAMFILYCILIYTNSIIITLSTVFANIFAITLAYFVYQFVFQIPYFPFMNFLAVIIIVGIGADDCFVYVKEWRLAQNEWNARKIEPSSKQKSARMIFLVSTAMRHAASSIFVTSITTAFAFFASYFSAITAIRCFGLFAGCVVVSNYVLMITWLPAIVAIVENNKTSLCICWRNYVESINESIDRFGETMQKMVLNLVNRFKYFFVLLFLTVGIASAVIVLYYPKLGLPDSQEFQLLEKDHPFELYDAKYKQNFGFEKTFTEAETFKLPIRFVWGIEEVDDGNYLIPSSKGSLHITNNLTLSSNDSQVWLLNFCKDLRNQSFYQPQDVSAILPNCFIENFIENMNKRCVDPMTNTSRSPCCDEHTFPFPPKVFEHCLPEMISSLYKSPRYIFVPGVSGPKFQRNSTKTGSPFATVRALVIEYESSQPFSTSFKEIANFTNHVQNWFNDILKSAPLGLQSGWFISELNFYDLQQTLSSGTIIAATIAMGSSLIVLLLFTMNILISIYAVLTVSFTILTTIAILVLLDWKLNILESVAVSTAIGLGIDFVFHYALNYRLCDKSDRVLSTNFALSRMIGPTLMAAITTWLAGVFMMFSNLLAYIQIGIFLVIVISVSWLYATFFFCSLLCVMGPKNKINKNNECEHLNHLNQDVELIQKENGHNLEIHESNGISED